MSSSPESLVASPTLVQTLVNDYIGYSGSSLISIDSDSALVDGLMSSDVANGLYPTTGLQDMAISLNGIVVRSLSFYYDREAIVTDLFFFLIVPLMQSGAEIQAIVQALSGLNGVTPALYNLIEQILTSISQMGTAKSAVDKLTSATGANGVLAALNLGKATNIVSNFDSLTSQLFLTLNTLNTNVATVLADSSADVTTLNTAIQSLQAPLDSTLASTIKGSNVILSGVTSLLKASLILKSALKNLTTLKGVMSTVSGLVNSLGLSNLKSVLGF